MAIYNTETMTEDEAIRLYFDLASQFGWQGTFFTREDAENSWQEYHDQSEPFTDETWNAVLLSWYWRKGLHEVLTERGWDLVHEAVGEALAESTK
jgi:hypothetical protein